MGKTVNINERRNGGGYFFVGKIHEADASTMTNGYNTERKCFIPKCFKTWDEAKKTATTNGYDVVDAVGKILYPATPHPNV